MNIERRLMRLERENRRLRAGLSAAALVAVASLLVGARGDDVPGLLQARRVQIVDDAGRPMAVLGEQDGQGVMALLDAAGNWKAQINASMAGATMALRNAAGDDLVVVGYDEQGNGTVRTGGRGGVPRVAIGSSEGGGGAVSTFDRAGRPHVKLATAHGGAGALTTFDADGRRMIQLTATTDGKGVIAAFDNSGRVRASWP